MMDAMSFVSPLDDLAEDGTPVSDSVFDLAFPTIPLEDDPSPPEEGPAGSTQLADDLLDFAADEAPEDEADEQTSAGGWDIVMDWETGEPVGIETGAAMRVDGENLTYQWFWKALNTERGEYALYPDDYGSDLDALIGAGLPDATLHSEVARTVRECGTFSDRIVDIGFDAIEADPLVARNGLFVVMELTTAASEDPISMELRT
jgi:hypothetical protein